MPASVPSVRPAISNASHGRWTHATRGPTDTPAVLPATHG
jgi:hypothetical protein